MRAIDLEARVISAVDRIRAGQSAEHDFIECKRDWPQDSKARQLAGSLNRAGGDPVVYIIGIDEKTGDVHDISGIDVLDWWGQITPKFDQMPPEMIRHISVPVGEGGEHVIAVAFASDRAPYVVKTGSANPSLEVPMREGTGTRTARRDELLRLLIPAVKVPPVVVLNAMLDATYYPATETDAGQGRTHIMPEGIECRGTVKLYFEHSGRELVTLPAHGMSGTATISQKNYPIQLVLDVDHSDDQGLRSQIGVVRTREAIVINGPGAATIHMKLEGVLPRARKLLAATSTVSVEIELEVLDAMKPLRVSARLRKRRLEPFDVTDPDIVGSWSFKHPNLPDL
ncbi:hypothetical protein QFZ60_001531 [Arthrobacter sp. B2I5]|uniref:hypothetical protein n=1 Tax=Arthrobacter sp. B2I5 TaxID=3042266 RepID=UPI00278318F1|nr:hypothetical protein [Arthrobacter sp. B2I5]MDQ0825358.1 hypothetical protein [Arthrobacter sp. B2I5]